jgi:long-chain acyl-CoA synthetase
MPRWTRLLPVRLARRLIEELLMRPFVFLYSRPKVVGWKHLRAEGAPYLFVSNHHSYWDTGLLKTVLPWSIRAKLAPAMTTRYHRVYFGQARGSFLQYWKERLQIRLVEFFFNAWPLPETAGFRSSLAYAGELADEGCSLLIFPEGRHVPEEELERFRGGIGIFARDLRMPVVPVYVEGTGEVLPDGTYWPQFGKARAVLGVPIRIEPDADPAEVTRRLEDAVRLLRRATRGG